jgi:hypothetical protein
MKILCSFDQAGVMPYSLGIMIHADPASRMIRPYLFLPQKGTRLDKAMVLAAWRTMILLTPVGQCYRYYSDTVGMEF